MNTKLMPAVLIGIGVGFLLYNLNIIPFTPWTLFWPGLLIIVGFSQLRNLRRSGARQSSGELVFWLIIITLGFYLLLPRIGISVPSLPWKVIWPLLLIVMGLLALFHRREPLFKFGPFEPSGDIPRYQSSFVGEYRRGPSNWVLDDLYLRQGIGSVTLDLTQAIIPDREINLEISGCVGEAALYLPPGLAFKAECSLALGEITVLDTNESGSQKYVQMQTVDYSSASRRLNIKIHWKIGEVRVRQIS